MFEDAAGPELGSRSEKQREGRMLKDYKHMTVAELLEARAVIDSLLPARNLVDVNMEEEMLMQLALLRELSQNTMIGTGENVGEAPLNQRAQVMNAITTLLKSLSDRQVEVFSSERFKRIEMLLVKHLKKQGGEFAKQFLDEYEAFVKGESQ
jgi:hypothetical protein